MMRKIYIKEEVCMGCHLCQVYCQQQHSRSKDLVKAFKAESPPPLPRVRIEQRGSVCFSVHCQHCDESPCVQACLTGALGRDADSGPVTVDEARCIGCWICILVCPFGAITRDTQRGQIVKCDLCQGEAMPVCVANCPNEALVYAEVTDGNTNAGCQVIAPVHGVRSFD